MKNIFLPILAIAIVSLTACSTNQDLVGLEEIDDVYYQSGVKLKGGPVSVSTIDEPSTFMTDASAAEQSYYQDMPYVPIEGEPQDEQLIESDENDYYDEDYARRLDNFHGTEPKEDYIYGNDYGYDTYEEIPNATAPYYNTNPQVNWSMSMGYSNYNPGMSWGLSFGSPYYGSPPFGMPNQAYAYGCYGNPYYINGCGCGYDPWYGSNPYGAYNAYYRPNYYGAPYYGYGYGDNSSNYVVNGQRSGSGRISRGGLIQPPANGGDPDGHGLVSAPQSNERWGVSTQPTSRNTASAGPKRNPVDFRRQNTRVNTLSPRTTSVSSTANTRATKTSRSNISPYTRSQQTRSSTQNQRSRSTYTYMNRSRTSNGASSTRSGNSSRSKPSYSPSRSSGGGGGGGSSPSRSSSPTRRR